MTKMEEETKNKEMKINELENKIDRNVENREKIFETKIRVLTNVKDSAVKMQKRFREKLEEKTKGLDEIGRRIDRNKIGKRETS